MNRRALAPLGLLLLALVPAPSRAADTKAADFLPDTTVLCRVGDRVTRVKDFVRMYFDSYVEDRPAQDSLGRVTFLDNIVAKDVLGQEALKRNAPLGFEDRIQLRESEQRALSNALYKSAVSESIGVTEADIEREYELFKWEVRLRHILFADFETANRVRNQLLRGAISWKAAYDKYAQQKSQDKGPEGELGWTVRGGSDLHLARQIFTLGVGGITAPIQDPDGWNVIQVADRRKGEPPALSAVRDFIQGQLTQDQMATRQEAVRSIIRKQIGMVYDTTRIARAAAKFQPARDFGRDDAGAGKMTFNIYVPDFTMEDTLGVLARYRDGVYTLGHFLHDYLGIQPLLRTNVNTPEEFKAQLEGFVFEPYLAEVARARGLDKDSMVVATLAKKREQLLVEHLYSDSVQSKISVDPQARRAYYQANLAGFYTYQTVKFASLWADSRAQADSFANVLKKGEKAEDIIAAQKLLGIERGSVRERSENDHGEYQKLIFEEMKPGDIDIEGPDKTGHYLVLQKLEHNPGRQLSYDEASGFIDESMQNIQAERLLKEYVARHATQYHIEKHPELVMKILLRDPTL